MCGAAMTGAAITGSLATFSDAIAGIAAAAAPLLAAVRTGPNLHVSGVACAPDAIVTTDQALPAMGSYTAVLADRSVAALRPGPRDPACNLAVLRPEAPLPIRPLAHAQVQVGSIALVLGADPDGSPTVRLCVVHRFLRTQGGLAPVLDLPPGSLDQGGAVLDAHGRLIGIAALGPANEPMAVPAAEIQRLIGGAVAAPAAVPPPPPPPPPAAGRKAWLGVALQPITVPDSLAGRAGQSSGRMVVNVTPGGPADAAGLIVGDVLLAINGSSMSGSHALRAFLEGDRIGTTASIRVLRDGAILTTSLVVAARPD
jgi:S1-C subfamily serine protease